MSDYKLEIAWKNVVFMALYHLWALHGLYYVVTLQIFFKTFVWLNLVMEIPQFGITCGAHRLWSHRSYKATLPLEIFLLICNTISNQNCVYVWARDHRVHHKFSDSNADPHNYSRGFFFAHVGWLLCKKHPDVTIKGSTVDLSDLDNNKLLMFQKKYFKILAPLCCFVFPTIIPWYFWNEDLYISFCVAGVLKYICTLHVTWCINSLAHAWGSKPYNLNIRPVESTIASFLTRGEGWHNYHHTFPWDYKTSELGSLSTGWNTLFIEVMAKLGLAYDLKTASKESIQHRLRITSDIQCHNGNLAKCYTKN